MGLKNSPYQPVLDNRFVSSSPSGLDWIGRIWIGVCLWCSERSPRDTLALCLCAVFLTAEMPISASLRASRSAIMQRVIWRKLSIRFRRFEPVTRLCSVAPPLGSSASHAFCSISVWQLASWTMCRRMTWRTAIEPQWTDEIHPVEEKLFG